MTKDMRAWVSRLTRWFAIDYHILATLRLRSWQIVSGTVMLLFVAQWLTPAEQGFYYTFSSLVGLQIFFELGLNFVVMQVVSHESAHLRVGSSGQLEGDTVNLDRLTSLAVLLHRWYRLAAVAFFVGVGTLGIFFFARSNELQLVSWLPAWCVMIAAVSGNLYLSPMMALIEGCGLVGQIAQMRFKQAIAGNLLAWGLLSCGAGLSAVSALPIVGFVFSIWWLRQHGQILHGLLARGIQPLKHRLRWRKDIFPFQWRIALSWMSGYLIFQLFSPMIFAHQGAAEAGRVGMAIAIFSTLSNVGMSWVNAKVPQFGAYIARGERLELNCLFVTVAKRSLAFISAGSIAVIIGIQLLAYLNVPLVERIASLPVLACLAVTTVANTFVFAAAGYMRAHKKEPMLAVSMWVGVLTLPAVYFGSIHSVWLPMLLSALISVCVALPWTIHLFLGYFRKPL